MAGNLADVQRVGQVVDHGVEQRLHTLVVVCGTAQHGVDFGVNGHLPNCALDFVDGEFLATEILFHELFIGFCHCLQQLLPVLLGTFHQVSGDFLDGRFGMLDGEPEVEGEVRAHFAFLGQHPVVSIEMEIAECDFKGFESHESQSQIVELAFSSASPPAVAYFLSARTTPAFQVLMVSFSSCSDSMSRITLSTGMR